jgi:hypothetical protein
MPTINRVAVNVPRDLATSMDEINNKAEQLREEIGGMSNTERAAVYGGYVGQSNKAIDPFDRKVNENDQNALVALAMSKGPMALAQALAAQGKVDPGAGVLHRSDKTSFLGGRLRSLGIVQGTAAKAADGTKVTGDGANVQIQVEYEATKKETKQILDATGAADAVKPDLDANGDPLSIKARINLDCRFAEDGIRDIHFSASIDHVPAIDAMRLLKEIGDDEIEFPAALPLKVLMQNNSTFSMQFNGLEGANVGLRANLSTLNELDDSDRIPDAMLSANADAEMETIDGKQFLDFGKLDISLDSKMNILKNQDGSYRFEIQDENGKYVEYDVKAKLGMDVTDGMLMMMLGMAAQGLDS